MSAMKKRYLVPRRSGGTGALFGRADGKACRAGHDRSLRRSRLTEPCQQPKLARDTTHETICG